MTGFLRSFGTIVAVLLGMSFLHGCGSGSPFQMEPVSGKVTYVDGSLIQADEIRIVFEPQGVEAVGKNAARASQGLVHMADGTFSNLTMIKPGDGAVVGHHKVVVLALKQDARGVGEPTNAVPARYHTARSTPLEVDVTSGGENHFELKIEKGP
ncbi:MAG: hypothetical protein JW829_17275 [Pirellulales bacterium]|nr:hypothetical protein [Pirellulales bacterium]